MNKCEFKFENSSGASMLCFGTALTLIYKYLPSDRRIIVITDEKVASCHSRITRRFERIVIPVGEDNKNLQTAMMVYQRLLEMGADTHSYLLGVGGGIVTDITGFVAATYMRGIPFSFVPTSLLAQVDASIGGKNGVNFNDYKNMVGTICLPEYIICDVSMLHSLPEREFRAGMAEVIKSAVIRDPWLFQTLESCDVDIRNGDFEELRNIVLAAASVKYVILVENETTPGMRTLLNLGHTIAHAIEKNTHEINHGEAVAIGLSMMAWASVKRGRMTAEDANRIDAVLQKFGFNLTPPVDMEKILQEARYDKKKFGSRIEVVLPEAIGSCVVEPMTFENFEAMFE